jgi:hypothetical protein
VHFLFPVWDPAVDRDQTRSDVTTALYLLRWLLDKVLVAFPHWIAGLWS